LGLQHGFSRSQRTILPFLTVPTRTSKLEPKKTKLVREITIPLFKKRTGVKVQITNMGCPSDIFKRLRRKKEKILKEKKMWQKKRPPIKGALYDVL
jgi:hypothetical protein